MVEIPVLITFFESDAYIPVFLQAGVLTGILAGGRINVTADADYGEWTPRRAGDSFNRVSFGLILHLPVHPELYGYIEPGHAPYMGKLHGRYGYQTDFPRLQPHLHLLVLTV